MTTNIELEVCPETGICSVIRTGVGKTDLMPDEVSAVRDAAGNVEQLRAILAEVDPAFAARLTPEELATIGQQLS